MKAKAILGAGVLVSAMGLAPVASAAVGDMVLYDDFNGKWIHPDKWEGGTGKANMETVWRMTDDGYLESGLRGFARIDQSEGRQKHRNSLFMSEDVAAGVTSIGAEAMVDWGYVRGCEGAASDSRVRFRIGGFFFNSGGGSYCGDRTGDIWAQIWIRDRHNDGLAKDEYDVSATVWRCDDSKCATGTSMFFKKLGTVMEDEMTKLYLHWDEENNQFIFETSQGGIVYDYSLDMTNNGTVSGRTYSKGIQTLTDIQNCAIDNDNRPYGVIDASVDNFYVNSDFQEKNEKFGGRTCKPEPECEACTLDPGHDEGACEDHEQGSGEGEEVDPIDPGDNGGEVEEPASTTMTSEDLDAVLAGQSTLNCSVVTGSRTSDARWKQDLSLDVDNTVVGHDISGYQIQWFNGSWSGWYMPGENDVDWKTNAGGQERRVWSYFYDHNYRYVHCEAKTESETVETASDEVKGEWVKGNWCYANGGKRYTSKNGKWYVLKGEKFELDSSASQKFHGKRLQARQGAMPAAQARELKIEARKALIAKRKADRKARQTAILEKRKAAREARKAAIAKKRAAR